MQQVPRQSTAALPLHFNPLAHGSARCSVQSEDKETRPGFATCDSSVCIHLAPFPSSLPKERRLSVLPSNYPHLSSTWSSFFACFFFSYQLPLLMEMRCRVPAGERRNFVTNRIEWTDACTRTNSSSRAVASATCWHQNVSLPPSRDTVRPANTSYKRQSADTCLRNASYVGHTNTVSRHVRSRHVCTKQTCRWRAQTGAAWRPKCEAEERGPNACRCSC